MGRIFYEANKLKNGRCNSVFLLPIKRSLLAKLAGEQQASPARELASLAITTVANVTKTVIRDVSNLKTLSLVMRYATLHTATYNTALLVITLLRSG